MEGGDEILAVLALVSQFEPRLSRGYIPMMDSMYNIRVGGQDGSGNQQGRNDVADVTNDNAPVVGLVFSTLQGCKAARALLKDGLVPPPGGHHIMTPSHAASSWTVDTGLWVKLEVLAPFIVSGAVSLAPFAAQFLATNLTTSAAVEACGDATALSKLWKVLARACGKVCDEKGTGDGGGDGRASVAGSSMEPVPVIAPATIVSSSVGGGTSTLFVPKTLSFPAAVDSTRFRTYRFRIPASRLGAEKLLLRSSPEDADVEFLVEVAAVGGVSVPPASIARIAIPAFNILSYPRVASAIIKDVIRVSNRRDAPFRGPSMETWNNNLLLVPEEWLQGSKARAFLERLLSNDECIDIDVDVPGDVTVRGLLATLNVHIEEPYSRGQRIMMFPTGRRTESFDMFAYNVSHMLTEATQTALRKHGRAKVWTTSRIVDAGHPDGNGWFVPSLTCLDIVASRSKLEAVTIEVDTAALATLLGRPAAAVTSLLKRFMIMSVVLKTQDRLRSTGGGMVDGEVLDGSRSVITPEWIEASREANAASDACVDLCALPSAPNRVVETSVVQDKLEHLRVEPPFGPTRFEVQAPPLIGVTFVVPGTSPELSSTVSSNGTVFVEDRCGRVLIAWDGDEGFGVGGRACAGAGVTASGVSGAAAGSSAAGQEPGGPRPLCGADMALFMSVTRVYLHVSTAYGVFPDFDFLRLVADELVAARAQDTAARENDGFPQGFTLPGY